MGYSAVVREKGWVDIEEAYVVTVIELSEIGIDGVDDLHALFKGAEWRIVFEPGAARENGQEKDLGRGDLFVDASDDLALAGGDLFGAVVVGVVGANQKDDDFGGEAFEFSLVDAPDDVLGLVATASKVGGLVWAEVMIPNVRGIGPACDDGVAEKEEINRS